MSYSKSRYNIDQLKIATIPIWKKLYADSTQGDSTYPLNINENNKAKTENVNKFIFIFD